MQKFEIKTKSKKIKAEEVLEKDIKRFGSAAHIFIPKRFVGKKAIILILPRVKKRGKSHLNKAKKKHKEK